MRYITYTEVANKNPCIEQLKLFGKFLGKRKKIGITTRNIKLALKSNLDIPWVVAESLFELEDQDIILDTNDPHLILRFAEYVTGADLNRCSYLINRFGSPSCMHCMKMLIEKIEREE